MSEYHVCGNCGHHRRDHALSRVGDCLNGACHCPLFYAVETFCADCARNPGLCDVHNDWGEPP